LADQTCSPGEPFAAAPEAQCGPRTPESILFAVNRSARCKEFHLTGQWTAESMSPLQSQLFGRGFFFRHELQAEWNCGKRQASITSVLNNATTTTTATPATLAPAMAERIRLARTRFALGARFNLN
jgi:hypothetical protein